ncbi:MAG: hypothetical protein BGO70_01030 [Bacteroidetes bacterium 43-93]|uniref:ATP-dependent nuclease n=1 Tax=uncultured Dysgonomonas sp. TaxID=206096 RepID=UPI000925A1F0|nr:ATP-binding protein [uncultured Dysgonomonas sp.]MBN9483137.1 AAA family ATPase [Bacteroidota bacterium]OJW96295.1 MAG: hypothetical protein BGO70_01030 [Bacteroidetes bacterium 43-93]
MAKIHSLQIQNFRGIKKFDQTFGQSDIVCLIGRGDSGKSTILEAISHVLSPQWNISIQDSDFTDCDTKTPIQIQVTLREVSGKLIQDDKFGLYLRGITNNAVIDSVDEAEEIALTIRLRINKDLEPQWFVFNEQQGEVHISAADRSRLNVFMVSDYVDRHFSWNKGNPLYSLLKQNESEGVDEEDVIINALREAKSKIDSHSFPELDTALQKVIVSAKTFGIDISKVANTIDFKDILVKEGKVSLHDTKVPFRLKGKGSKRLLSIAIQTSLAEQRGIILIDEIEQGLEPDRVQHLVATLKKNNFGQIFLTTHSQDVLVELSTSDLFLMRQGASMLKTFSTDLQGLLRGNPTSFFANKIIVCEGATEIGICRALNAFKIEKGQSNAAYQGVRFADGKGSQGVVYTDGFYDSGFSTCLFCDSDLKKDNQDVNKNKDRLSKKGIKLVDWDSGDCLETAVFKYLPFDAMSDVLACATAFKEAEEGGDLTIHKKAIWEGIAAKFGRECPSTFTAETDSPALRAAMAKAATAKNKSWFKSQSKGNELGKIIFKHWDAISDNKLKHQLNELSKFIDGNGL